MLETVNTCAECLRAREKGKGRAKRTKKGKKGKENLTQEKVLPIFNKFYLKEEERSQKSQEESTCGLHEGANDRERPQASVQISASHSPLLLSQGCLLLLLLLLFFSFGFFLPSFLSYLFVCLAIHLLVGFV